MKNPKTYLSRRRFTKLTSAAVASLPLMGFSKTIMHSDNETLNELEIHLFSKHLQFLNYKDMAAATAEMGFNGLDLTVRPKGHVLPEKVTNDLPKAIEAINSYGLQQAMITTNIWDSTNPINKTVLETASSLGIKYFRTGWLKYPTEKEITESQILFGKQAKDLEAFNENLGLIGCYQNHSGNHVGAPIWDLPKILAETNNKHIGCQYDIRHAVVEGGQSWELGLKVIRPFIKTLVIKDFIWKKQNGIWKPLNVPLGKGQVNFKKYFSILKKYKIQVPISLHLEYDLGGAEHGRKQINMSKEQVFNYMKSDLKYLKRTWEQAD